MKLVFDEKVYKRHYKLTFSQLLFLLNLSNPINEEEKRELINKGFISETFKNGFFTSDEVFMMPSGIDLLEKIAFDSDVDFNERNRINNLSRQLMKLFPKGNKPGTNYSWRGNARDIQNKLYTFLREYGEYSDEQIIDATNRYLKAYEQDTKYMQLLKYFIWKKVNGEISSELANWIENEDENGYTELKTHKLV